MVRVFSVMSVNANDVLNISLLRQPNSAAPSVNHIHEYFARYPDFDYQQTEPFLREFQRLTRLKQWRGPRLEEEREALRSAMVLQFNAMYGKDAKDLRAWKALCDALGVDPIPDSITKCRKVSLLRFVHAHLS